MARRMPCATMLAMLATLPLLAPACTRPDPSERQTTAEPDPSARPARDPAELLVGKWRMIAEEAAADGSRISGQARRLLEFGDDGHYAAQNYIESLEGRWTLSGEALSLGERSATLESVDSTTLVLVEDLPEIYLRGGEPMRVRNTYRRVSEAELGPMLGAAPQRSVPTPGTYLGAYDYSMSKLPTMEISISRHIDGRARLQLAEDGSVSGCFGIAAHRSHSRSKYASRDGKHHHDEDDDRWLLGVRGTWEALEGSARVTIAQGRYNSCATAGEGHPLGEFELDCVALASNERLPTRALACRIVAGPSSLEQLALNPADTERAGPYTLQIEPRGHIEPDTGRPWLLLGAAPGMRVSSEDGRRTETPEVDFRADDVDFVEQKYLRQPPSE